MTTKLESAELGEVRGSPIDPSPVSASACEQVDDDRAETHPHDQSAGEQPWIELQAENRRLRDVIELQTELIASVAHELRQPLASVLGSTELLLAGGCDPAARRLYLQIISREIRRLGYLTDELLEGPPAMKGDSTFSPEPRKRIGRMIANLLSNAIKYSPEGGAVVVSAEAHDETVRVSVHDRQGSTFCFDLPQCSTATGSLMRTSPSVAVTGAARAQAAGIGAHGSRV
jgi:signal transduction histidine kinase